MFVRSRLTTCLQNRIVCRTQQPIVRHLIRGESTTTQSSQQQSNTNGPTGIVMMNMGGPETIPEVGPFLHRLFTDRDIIEMPLQKWTAPFLAKRRTPHVSKLYESIGGGSPITRLTHEQGKRMVALLDEIRPESAPHKYYIGFRYAGPLIDQALEQMQADGVKRAIAFSQYPQFSCTTAGSSLNQLWATLQANKLEDRFQWSVIDRWPTHPKFIKAVSEMVKIGLAKFSEKAKDDVVILFSAHSLPLRTVFKGDQYPAEVSATVYAVMQQLQFSHRYMLVWQSQVGKIPWLGPQTDVILKSLGRTKKSVLVVPIAFTTDHIETLSEIDNEFAEVAKEAGIKEFHRAPSLNYEDVTIDALAAVVKDHLDQNQLHSLQYKFRCPECVKPHCRSVLNPATNCTVSALSHQ